MRRLVPLVLLVLLVLLVGCVRSAPGPRTGPVAPRETPRPALGLDGPEAAKALLRSLAESDVTVAIEAPQGFVCQTFRASPLADDASIGVLTGIERATAAIELRYAIEGSAFTIDTPRVVRYGPEVTFGFRPSDLPSCVEQYSIVAGDEAAIESDRGSLYRSRAACEDAVEIGRVNPFELGSCGARLDHVAERAAREPEATWEPLLSVMRRSGRVYELVLGDQASCVAWRFHPDGGSPQRGSMVTVWREGAERWVTDYGYRYRGATLLLLGPHSRGFAHGELIGGGGFTCGASLYVEPSDGFVRVGSARWYPERSTCEAALHELSTQSPASLASLGLAPNGC